MTFFPNPTQSKPIKRREPTRVKKSIFGTNWQPPNRERVGSKNSYAHVHVCNLMKSLLNVLARSEIINITILPVKKHL